MAGIEHASPYFWPPIKLPKEVDPFGPAAGYVEHAALMLAVERFWYPELYDPISGQRLEPVTAKRRRGRPKRVRTREEYARDAVIWDKSVPTSLPKPPKEMNDDSTPPGE